MNDREVRSSNEATNPILQNCVLVWFDPDIDRSSETFRNDLALLKTMVNDIHVFKEIDACFDFLTDIEDQYIHFIVPEAIAQPIIEDIHDVSALYRIYVSIPNSFEKTITTSSSWIDTWIKIKRVYRNILVICEDLRLEIEKCDPNSTPISLIPFEDITNININQLEPSLMYVQQLKDILLRMKFDEQSRKDVIAHCRANLPQCDSTRNLLTEFERDYSPDKAIWWYTRSCFSYQMLNQALRHLNADIIVLMGFFSLTSITRLTNIIDNHFMFTEVKHCRRMTL
jgi:hypothetical protein